MALGNVSPRDWAPCLRPVPTMAPTSRLGGAEATLTSSTKSRESAGESMIPATEALERLRAGNDRFAAGARGLEPPQHLARRKELTAGQHPFAVVIGCSDSRVPAEIVFDQGLGDLFVIRVAGNIVAPSQVGSVEFAVAALGVRLVVVLGHSQCGAIAATIEEIETPSENPSEGWQAILDRVRPAVLSVATDLRHDPEAVAREAVRANVLSSVDELSRASKTIEQEVTDRGLLVIGAVYSLETGIVDFLGGAKAHESS